MKKDNIPIYLCLIFILLLGSLLYVFGLNQRYKYICFNTEIIKDTLITEEHLKVCTSKKKLSEDAITEKEQLLSEDPYISYKLNKDSYQKGQILYKKDFEIYEHPKLIDEEIELLTKIQVESSIDGEQNYINDNEELIKYNIYIKNKKLYATNLNSGEIQLIFDTEEVKNIAIRPLCCTGNGNLLILTMDGNVYISENDVNYFFSFNFPFKKLEVTDIVKLKLVPKNEYDTTKELYGINSKNEEILCQ